MGTTEQHGNPALTPGVVALARGPLPGTAVDIRDVDGVRVGTYRSVRLTFKKQLVNRLAANGVMLIRVVPREGNPCAVAITRQDFERVFGEVLESRSWKTRGSHDFSTFPTKAKPFVVPE